MKRIHRHNVEMAEKARGDSVSSTSRGSHGTDELDVLQSQLAGVLQIIPMTIGSCWTVEGRLLYKNHISACKIEKITIGRLPIRITAANSLVNSYGNKDLIEIVRSYGDPKRP